VMLSGHFDVVAPEPDESQFTPRVEGDFLWGRGAADMKTVLATYLVWMKDRRRRGQALPPVNLALIGNEENGESEATGTPHLLKLLAEEAAMQGHEYAPQLFIAGERTAEREGQLIGEICTRNRGVMRFEVQAHGQRGHTGIAHAKRDLTERLLEARTQIESILSGHLTLVGEDGWQSQARFPFIQVGTPGVYNISAELGLLGVEVRSIPEDDINGLVDELRAYCTSEDLELRFSVMENGVACDPDNRYLGALVQAVEQASRQSPILGRKLAGTSARFAPQGQGVVWGQGGVSPHSKDERHFIPSILPYYRALEAFGDRLLELS
jgi:succinyl-diaminopimelate desuccinylase